MTLDGLLYEKGPLGQFYEVRFLSIHIISHFQNGPDGKLHRVSAEVQRQLLDLVEDQKQLLERQKEMQLLAESKVPDVYRKSPSPQVGSLLNFKF
jgi:hypothetical protein